MTEAFEDGIYLVRVRAQVMTRDDSTGGWVPMGGGGLSNVSVRKRIIHPTDTDTKHEYLIFGKRIADQTVVLSCVIKKDFEYNKVMPTFHHWKTGDKKFGLTFQTAADARAFDKGVRTAVEELLDDDVGDDDVFMTLNLPVERGDSRSSSDSSSGRHHAPQPQPPPVLVARPTHAHTHAHHQQLQHQQQQQGDADTYSYVQLTGHDYTYVHGVLEEGANLDKKGNNSGGSNSKQRKQRCRHCQQLYASEEANVRGACRYAPDPIKEGIERVACLACARCFVYSCCGEGGGGEGGVGGEVCSCADCSRCSWGCGRRWLAVALLSLLVPCLWCYPPLRACHWCGVACGLCGATHKPDS